MANIRSTNQIILSMLDFLRLAQPDADLKPGTVARDLMIEAPATQLGLLYESVADISNKQSLRLVIGSDLDKLAKNFGLVRRGASSSSGIALLTFTSVNAPISISKGSLISSNGGISFVVSSNVVISPEASNFYKSIASKYKDQLSYIGIVDQYAVEVNVIASSAGTVGNVGKYSLSSTTITGITNVTNINAFSGGTDQENDAVFRNRVLSTFNGASVGTALGYYNAAISTAQVVDARVIEPGDPLMTRDGTVVKVVAGKTVIASEGSGGKVDVYILGSAVEENTDTYIYTNKSNSSDISSAKNDVVLGQIIGDENKTINKKRIDNLKTGVTPAQPVMDIIQVSGSNSGSNFKEKSVDQYGRVTGNYELIKDTGAFAGSPWAFDKFHWISDHVDFQEDKLKGQAFGQDVTTYKEVLEIPSIKQNISITNENSTVTYDRSIIQLLHTPVSNVTRVLNATTGELYLVTNQNYDETTPFNSTGRIKISGNTLPSSSDTLQVDYNWIVEYDQYSDYDGLVFTNNSRDVVDSIDWGYPYLVKDELIKFTLDGGLNYYTGTSTFNVNSVLSVGKFLLVSGTVGVITSGVYTNSLCINVHNLDIPTLSVDSVKLKNSNTEIYNTAQATGNFSNSAEVVGIDIKYVTQIILPSDSPAKLGDAVDVYLNTADTFNVNNVLGSSNGNQITVPQASVDSSANTVYMNVTYIASIGELFSSAINSLPATKAGNGYLLNNNSYDNGAPFNNFKKENQIVQKNLSNQFYIEINLPSLNITLASEMVASVIRISDSVELWNSNNQGSITVGTSGNYQVILNGSNTPAIGDRVLVVYRFNDTRKSQPFSFSNTPIKNYLTALDFDSTSQKFFVNLSQFTNQNSGLQFQILDQNSVTPLATVSDGYLVAPGGNVATLSSLSYNFNSIVDLTSKKIKITNATAPNNNGVYDIVSFDGLTQVTISSGAGKISKNQVSIIKLTDGKEIWSADVGTIDTVNNRLLLPNSSNLSAGDKVFLQLFNSKNLNKTPTRIAVEVTDQVVNTGVITLAGTTIFKVKDMVFTASSNGLKINLAEAIRKSLSLSSNLALPSNIKLAKLLKLEKVTTVSNTNDEVVQILATYDVKNTQLKNNVWYSDEMLLNESLGVTEFVLPGTGNNTATLESRNLPAIGDKLRVSFYYTVSNDSENLSYTRNGKLYTNKKFASLDKIYVSSGFKSSQSSKVTLSTFTQPPLGANYKINYSYLAPKQNERIVINYNYNRLITDVTFALERSRPINADILAKAATRTLVDITMNVVIADESKGSTTIILQNLKDRLVSALATTVLGDILDTTSLNTMAESIPGIKRARILYFNRTGEMGKASILQAAENEYFVSNNVVINKESR